MSEMNRPIRDQGEWCHWVDSAVGTTMKTPLFFPRSVRQNCSPPPCRRTSCSVRLHWLSPHWYDCNLCPDRTNWWFPLDEYIKLWSRWSHPGAWSASESLMCLDSWSDATVSMDPPLCLLSSLLKNDEGHLTNGGSQRCEIAASRPVFVSSA